MHAEVTEGEAGSGQERGERATLVGQDLAAPDDVDADDLADLAGLDVGQRLLDLRVEQGEVIHGRHPPGSLGRRRDGRAIIEILGHGLLDEDIAPELHGGDGHAGMDVRGSEHVNDVGPGRDQRLE